ncbi:MAG: glycine zipper 2TM domain-containing protein [Pseudomonadota bacterium]
MSALIKSPFKTSLRATAVAAMGLVAVGCASDLSGNTYGRSAVGVPAENFGGTLISYRQVKLDGTRSGVGTATGAVVGGALGSTIGGGTEERIAAGVAGAVLGGLAGRATEQGVSSSTAFEYTVRLDDDGRIVTIVQGDKQPIAAAGAPVRVLYGDRVRVVPAY